MFSAESRYFSNILDGILILFECFEEKWNICQIFWVEIWYFPIVLGANMKPFKYFVWYFCVSRMFRVRTRYFLNVFFTKYDIFECFSEINTSSKYETKSRTFWMFSGQIQIISEYFLHKYDTSQMFWIPIRYFRNILDTNSMSLKWLKAFERA